MYPPAFTQIRFVTFHGDEIYAVIRLIEARRARRAGRLLLLFARTDQPCHELAWNPR